MHKHKVQLAIDPRLTYLITLEGKLCVVDRAAWLYATSPLHDGGLVHSSYSATKENREIAIFPDMPFILLKAEGTEDGYAGSLQILLEDKIKYICAGCQPIELKDALKYRKKYGK